MVEINSNCLATTGVKDFKFANKILLSKMSSKEQISVIGIIQI